MMMMIMINDDDDDVARLNKHAQRTNAYWTNITFSVTFLITRNGIDSCQINCYY